MEKTFAIVKPDAVGNGHIGKVLSRIEDEGFRIVAMRMLHLTRGEAEGFYAVHRERPFFDSLTAYMSSGPVVALVLERDDAIPHWRKTMGATDPGKAEPGTIRKQIGESIERNAVHGSDAQETAAVEIAYFFRGVDQLSNR